MVSSPKEERIKRHQVISVGILKEPGEDKVIWLINNIDIGAFPKRNSLKIKGMKKTEKNHELTRHLVIPRGMIEKIVTVGELFLSFDDKN